MKRLGLSARLTLVLVVLLAVAQAAGLLAYVGLREGEAAWRLPVPARIAAAADLLDRAAPEDRDDLLVAMNGDATRFFIAEGSPEGYREGGGFARRLFNGYGSVLRGRDARLLFPVDRRDLVRPRPSGGPAGYAFSVALADGRRLIVTPSTTQRRRSVVFGLLVFNLLIGVAVAWVVWRSVRSATRDLEAIAEASDRFAVDLTAPPMQAGNGREAQMVASAFNRMRDRIQSLMSERMRMLAAVAHDLKTLLTRLRLRAAYIGDDDQRGRADRDIALMDRLIEDVLLVARGEERPAALVSVEVAEMLAEIARERQALAQQVTIDRLDAGSIQADAVALRRVVENLVENAVVYAGSAELRFEREGGDWRIRIVDHGPGLAPDFAPRAFEPFERGEASRSRGTGGAGLGLAIARSLARQMGADIDLGQTPGGGVTATVGPLGRTA